MRLSTGRQSAIEQQPTRVPGCFRLSYQGASERSAPSGGAARVTGTARAVSLRARATSRIIEGLQVETLMKRSRQRFGRTQKSPAVFCRAFASEAPGRRCLFVG